MRAFTVEDASCIAADASIFNLWDLNRGPAMIVGVGLLSRLASFSIDYGARAFDARLAGWTLSPGIRSALAERVRLGYGLPD